MFSNNERPHLALPAHSKIHQLNALQSFDAHAEHTENPQNKNSN